jgi:RNA-directed DNA polymerase
MAGIAAVLTSKEFSCWQEDNGSKSIWSGGAKSRGRVSRPFAKIRHRRALACRQALLRIASRQSSDLGEREGPFALPVNAPPLLVSFADEESLSRALDPNTRAEFTEQIAALTLKGLPPLVSARIAGTLFGLSTKFIGAMARNPGRYYRTFTIRSGKKSREINAPRVALKIIQKWLGYHLARAIHFDSNVFGFIEGRSAPMAAAKHCGAKWIYSVDIKDFFPSTRPNQVISALTGIGYPSHAASLIASLCTLNGGLAQGSPASPVLSNLVFRMADSQLARISQDLDTRFTRYADDIVFSGTTEFPNSLPSAVKQVIAAGGWTLSPSKEYFAASPMRLKVHGLLVHGAAPRLTKGYRNRIRAFQHLLMHQKISPTDVPRILGHLAYATSIEAL